eukprot:GDKI01049593.1.p1 GENE.GDKI01049593.1~~GDKI01049593.1.p1  ORF type:complete len:217 (-),score=71.36 GDKI01049593.1:142-792(-)
MPLAQLCELNEAQKPVLMEEEEITAEETNTHMYINDKCEGKGTMYLTTKRVMWVNSEDSSKAWCVDYPTVVIHAVSSDTAVCPRPCLYCQLDGYDPDACAAESEGEEEGGEETQEETHDGPTELRFAPENETRLQHLFKCFCEMAALNPDPMGGDDTDAGQELFTQFMIEQMRNRSAGGDAQAGGEGECEGDDDGCEEGDECDGEEEEGEMEDAQE